MPEIKRGNERIPVEPELVVYCGPMFSGKSTRLVGELRVAPHAKYEVIAFKPDIDTRRGDGINTEDGGNFPATSVDRTRPEKILRMVGPDIDIVGIDEAQFFGEGLVEVCQTLVRRGKAVWVAGLDKDFKGEPFGQMAKLKQEADRVVSLLAFCAVCGRPASRTQRLVNGKPANYNDPIVVVGAAELYQARCRRHHKVPGKPK